MQVYLGVKFEREIQEFSLKPLFENKICLDSSCPTDFPHDFVTFLGKRLTPS